MNVMSQWKFRKEEGQLSIKSLLDQNPLAKKRTPPSAECPNKKRSHITAENSTPPDLHNSYINKMEGENQTGSIGKDSRFNNFSDEFIAFGNMMCQKLNEIMEPLKTSQDNMQDSMKLLLEDGQNYKNVSLACNKIEGEQEKITSKCDKMEQENNKLRSRLNRLENKMLQKNLIFHDIKEDNWEDEESIKERIWKCISHSVDEDESRKQMKITRGIGINGLKRLGRFHEGHNRPLSVCFEKQHHVETLLGNKKLLPKGVYIDREYTKETEGSRKIL